MVGIVRGQRLRFGLRQSQHQLARRFAGERQFIHLRGDAFKGHFQLFEQFAAVAGSGRKNKWQHNFFTGLW